jgi:hypothetical protein
VVSFTPLSLYLRGNSPRYPLDRRLGDPRASLDDVEKIKFLTLQGLELRPFGRSARRQSLYRLIKRKMLSSLVISFTAECNTCNVSVCSIGSDSTMYTMQHVMVSVQSEDSIRNLEINAPRISEQFRSEALRQHGGGGGRNTNKTRWKHHMKLFVKIPVVSKQALKYVTDRHRFTTINRLRHSASIGTQVVYNWTTNSSLYHSHGS